MKSSTISTYANFYVIGLSYKKADATIRGHFSLNTEMKETLLKEAKKSGIANILAVSTCNRTELYGFAQHPFQLIKLLCTHTRGTVEAFEKAGYVYKNHEAVTQLFRVGTGLDSQILGDFEIISQLKQSFNTSKALALTNPFLERLCNSVIQASKRIKNETGLSSGATSAAFAAVQYLLKNVRNISAQHILLLGTGKTGRNTCENLVKHTQNKHITLINRTKDKAGKIAGKFNLTVKAYADLPVEIRKADIIIVATSAQQPIISKVLIPEDKPLIIIDLSIPKNVEDSIASMANVTLVHLDHLSQITDETLAKRKQDIPQAERIIESVKSEFTDWAETRKFAPTIKALKKKLETLKDTEIDFQRKKISDFNEQQAEILSNRIIQKITTQFASHLKTNNRNTEESITLIRQVFQLESEM